MDTKAWFIEIDDSLDDLMFKKMLSLVLPSKANRILKYRANIDRKLSLYADIFVRYMICKISDTTNDSLVFYKSTDGKPYIKSERNLYFNISHTRNAILIGIGENEIGVDIEKVGEFEKSVVNRCFTKKEIERVNISAKDNKNEEYYSLWTKKEAYLKYIGTGLKEFPCYLDISSQEDCEIKTFKLLNYIMSICCAEKFYGDINYIEESSFKTITNFLAR